MRGKKQKIHIPAAGFTDSTAGCLINRCSMLKQAHDLHTGSSKVMTV